MKLKWIILVWFVVLTPSPSVSGTEAYYINGNRVLLYKVINWWYDCLPQESFDLCGYPIVYRNDGNVRVQYHLPTKELILTVTNGFAQMISLFNSEGQKKASRLINCIQLNERTFGEIKTEAFGGRFDISGQLVMQGIEKETAALFCQMEDGLRFEIKGRIAGLMNGRIALHPDGEFIKSCYGPLQNPGEKVSVNLLVHNADADELLASFSLAVVE